MTETEWRTLEEQEPPKAWARRIAGAMKPWEIAYIVDALDPAILAGDDHSTSAKRRKRTMRPDFSLADDLARRAAVAKLDQPFGKKAA